MGGLRDCIVVLNAFVLFQAGAVVGTEAPAARFEPQVAILCDSSKGQYLAQYMSEQGQWLTDPNAKTTCLKDKMEILEYCKKVN